MTRLEDDHYCFACGIDNPIGLKVDIRRGERESELRWRPTREFQGFREILHGGIVSTLLDEAMAHAVLGVVSGAATARMSVQFRCPVRTDSEITVRARVVERRGRVVSASASLFQQGDEMATAEGKFVIVRAESPAAGGEG